MQMLKIYFCKKSCPTDREKKKKGLWGNLKPFPFKLSMENAQEVLTKFPPPGIFIAHCKVAFSICYRLSLPLWGWEGLGQCGRICATATSPTITPQSTDVRGGARTLLPLEQTPTPLNSWWGLISPSTVPRQLWGRKRSTGLSWRAEKSPEVCWAMAEPEPLNHLRDCCATFLLKPTWSCTRLGLVLTNC